MEEHCKGPGSPPHCPLSYCTLELPQDIPLPPALHEAWSCSHGNHRTTLGAMLPAKRGGRATSAHSILLTSSTQFNTRGPSLLSEGAGTSQCPRESPAAMENFIPVLACFLSQLIYIYCALKINSKWFLWFLKKQNLWAQSLPMRKTFSAHWDCPNLFACSSFYP